MTETQWPYPNEAGFLAEEQCDVLVLTRYPHSQSSVVSPEDIEAGIDLMNAFSARRL